MNTKNKKSKTNIQIKRQTDRQTLKNVVRRFSHTYGSTASDL